MKIDQELSDKTTIFDRIAVGFLSAVLASIASLFLWLIFGFVFNFEVLPIEIFYIFVGVMFLLGFFTLDKYFIEILVPAWNFIFGAF